MKLKIRIHDLDGENLKRYEALTRSLVRQYKISADIYQVQEVLEHGRLGIDGCLPVLEINGIFVSKGKTLTVELVEPFFQKLAAMHQSKLKE